MKEIKEMLSQGKLTDVIGHIESLLREDPMNVDLKSSLIELLCIDGDLERADTKLNQMVQKHPDFLIGASNLRQLIRAQQSRLDFANGQSVPSLFVETNQEIEALMKLRVEMNQGTVDSISDHAAALEDIRQPIALDINSKTQQQVRDLDDSLAGFIEVFGTDGKYYVAQMSDIEYIHFKPVTSIIEQVWRRVDIGVKNGPSGEAHIPMVYCNNTTDAQKLGRETDWQEIAPGVMTGVGLKMWYVDDTGIAITDIQSIGSLA